MKEPVNAQLPSRLRLMSIERCIPGNFDFKVMGTILGCVLQLPTQGYKELMFRHFRSISFLKGQVECPIYPPNPTALKAYPLGSKPTVIVLHPIIISEQTNNHTSCTTPCPTRSHNMEHEGISLTWQGASSNELVSTNRWLMFENLLLCSRILRGG